MSIILHQYQTFVIRHHLKKQIVFKHHHLLGFALAISLLSTGILVASGNHLLASYDPFGSQPATDYYQRSDQTEPGRLTPAPANNYSRTYKRAVKRFYRLPILMYHYVKANTDSNKLAGLFITPEEFEAQLQELAKQNYSTILLRDLSQDLVQGRPVPTRAVALTFDDGYNDFYTTVYPLLKKYEAKATVYVIVNDLDQPGYLTKQQVRELAQSGLVEIGSHTLNHANLGATDDRQAALEILDSKIDLEQIISGPVYSFAYPYGVFGNRDIKLAEDAGYLSGVSTYEGVNQGRQNLFYLYRLRPGARTGESFATWLASAGTPTAAR